MGGSVTISRAKAQMEDTSESKEEDIEPLITKGRKPNKSHREIEASQEKEPGKKSSLYCLFKIFLLDKQLGE